MTIKNTYVLAFGALMVLGAAVPLIAQTDLTRPPVTANKKAAEELKGVDLEGVRAAPDGKPGLPTLPVPRSDDKDLSGDLVTSAESAKELVGRHLPKSEGGQYLLAACIGFGALGALVIGWALSRKRR